MNEGAPGAPRLTIAIPTVNRASLVTRAIDSALAQTFPSIEILVSNNGSKDETRSVLERYEGTPKLRILQREATIPAGEHGNLLIREARGEFFLGLSDDDWIEPRFAETVLDFYDRHPEVSFVWTGCSLHYADIETPAKTGPEIEDGGEFLAAFLAGERNPCWCAVVSRTADLRRLGPQPPEVICGDMFYWTKLAARGKIGCVAAPLSHYVCFRDHSDGEAGGSSVLAWAADTRRWVDDIVASCEGSGAGPARKDLRRHAAQFLFRSTANQFVWQALRGVSRASLLSSVRPALRYLHGPDPSPWIRVVAALIAPRWLLRQRMLAEARRRARESRR